MKTFVQQFQEIVKNFGDKTALVYGDRQATYQELDRLSGRIAAKLIERGAKKEKIYPIVLPRGIDYIASEIGILKAGAAFSPLSAEYPADRIAYIKKDCRCDFLIDEAFIKEAKACQPLVKLPAVSWNDAAMVIYTSGSTGNPKGIVHEHYSFTRAIIRQLPVGCKPGGVEMSVTPFNFAISVADIFVPLWVGASIHILSEGDRKDICAVDRYIDSHGITASVISPQLLKRLPDRESTLQNICCGGERISNIFKQHQNIYNSYGLSETLSIAIAFPLDHAYDNTPVGKPLEDFTVYLLDEEGRQVKDGEEGEICIAGPLARGYINLPAHTAKTFVKNPYATGKLDSRMLHTNDIGKRLPDGNIVYVNRKDWMVKVNGQRVEMGEVEIQLGKIDGVETAVVKSFEDDNGQTYLCGYYLCRKSVPEEKIRTKLAQKFPGYMIPRFLVQVERFPLNANGKLDRKALTPPEASSFKKEYIAPQNPVQEQICKGFEKVLNLEHIGIEDDFFSIGGDSIKVVILQEELSGLHLSSSAIFEGRTPEKIALSASRQSAGKSRFAGMDTRREFYPMTDSQIGIYLECIREPESCMYNNLASFLFPKDMEIDPHKLKNALITVIEGFPFMKIHVAEQNGTPCIVPNNTLSYEIPVKSLDHVEIAAAAKAFIRPFSLLEGPLFRFEVNILPNKDILLLGDMHHIITDGTSTALFFSRVAMAYEGKKLEAEQVDSFMLSNYELGIKNTEEYKESKAFFDTLLAGVEVNSDLEPDEPFLTDGKEKECRIELISLRNFLSIETLRRRLKEYGITESSLFLSAFSYALAKQTGQEEALFCTVDNGRHTPDLRGTMGMLVRTLPFYVRIDEEKKAKDFLQEVQNRLFQCIKHDNCSFVELANDYGIKSDIIFVYQGDTLNGITLNGRFIPMQIHKLGDSMANLSLDVLKHNEDYTLSFEYRSDLYARRTIIRLAKLVITAIRGFLMGDQMKTLPLCDEDDTADYQKFNENTVSVDRRLTLVDLFRKQVKETPKRNAVVYRDTALTYEQLDLLSEKLARLLAKEGVKPEVPVGLMVRRSEIFPVCAFGIQKAGGACQPLDANYPQDRLQYMLEDSGAPVVVMDESLRELLPAYKGKVIFTKDIAAAAPDPDVTLCPPKAENLFALLYTSGSTGKPKGCMIEHRNIVNFCLSFQKKFQITCEDRATAYGSFGFDASMQDLYPYLTKGACVYIVSEETRLDLPGLHKLVEENKITMMDCTTQLGRQYVCAYPDSPTLRGMSVGGEKLVPCIPPHYPFYNTYGPTECTIYVTDFLIDRDYVSVPIGKPFGNCDIYIVDKYRRLLPPGVPGELCIAGYPVTRGYLNRPDLTREKYVENPFNSTPGYEKMYLTGDVCRYLSDGNIQFVGRRDEQVKIRGFRIELTEIERRIRAFDGITDACVVARDLPAGGKAVVAYIVEESPVSIPALHAFIAQELPWYMVPSVTVRIDKIPLNPNGKVDKRRLPAPKTEVKQSSDCARPLNRLEKELRSMALEITGQTDFDMEASLITAGFSSLSMMMLASCVYEHFGCRLNVSKLLGEEASMFDLENMVLEQLLTQEEKKESTKQSQKIRQTEMPLSSAQLGVFYDCMKRPDALLYNIPMLFVFSKQTDSQRLAKAAQMVIEAHPALTAHLVEKEETVVQVLSGKEPAKVSVLQMDEEQLLREKKSFARPFDLFEGPLYRLKIVCTPERTALLMDTHHIVFDGLSMSVFLEELKRAYETGKPAGESYTFFDAARKENEVLHSLQGKEAEAYYDALFKNFENASDIPCDLQGKEEDGILGECVSTLNEELIDGFCRANAVTPAALFLAGVFYTVSRYTSDRNVFMSMICSGREDGMYQDSFGMFVKTLPLAVQVTPGTDSISFIKHAGTIMHKAIEHSVYPFVTRSGQYGYIPQINYACQLGVDASVIFEGEQIKEEVLTNPLPKFHISIHIETKDGLPAVCIQYNTALYSAPYMQQFADAIAQSVLHMIQAPQSDIVSVSLLNKAQKELVERFGQGETAEIPQRLLHKLLTEQAYKNPDKTALIACDGRLSYQEFEARSNRIANALVQRGVKQGSRVALLLPRTSHLLLAMYGVLKAGAAFIPCDPKYPQERISYILSDSAASFILTTKDRTEQFSRGKALDVSELLACKEENAPAVSLQPDDLAYLIYTSGSTGRPKGVMLTHSGITNYIYDHPANVHIHALKHNAHTMVSVTTVSFDMSLKETVAILSSGLTLALADETQAQNPAQLVELFEQVNGDAFNATPSRMEQYLELPAFCKALAKCRVVMCGGEKYSSKLLMRLQSITRARIFNTYGPTEITVSSNACELTDRTDVTVGKPLLNVREFIVDSDQNSLPQGVIGELLVGGAGVARGYWNNEALTQKQFVEYRGMRVYRTGDYAKWTPDGNVVILGRTDNQVKLRGLRIELGEIEKRMLADNRVRQAVVLIRAINGTEHLCAYFTADETISAQEMKETLQKSLTAYMVPTAYLQLQKMPVTPNGKADVKKLPAPVPAQSGKYTAPATDMEKMLCDIFAQTLRLNTVGATDSFFDLGGTSLTVTNVLIKANEQGLAISYGDVFTCKTPRELAQKLQGGAKVQEAEEQYDYSRIDKLLQENTLSALQSGRQEKIGNLLLTGATGFLGIHILHAFLKQEQGEVTCLLRGLGARTAKMRLQAKLFYYFENNYEELFGKRIHLVEGDVTQTGWVEEIKGRSIHTVINCAALVKHFSNQTDIEDVNIGGAENLLAFCKQSGAMMVQVSTGSVAGDRVDGFPSVDNTLDEQKLYFGQNIDNQYVRSKFMAERLVLEAAQQGVPAKIMRVGNLAAREHDGEFQINFTTNGFMGRLKAYLVIGAFPYSAMNTMVEMAPVDSTARAILLLCKTPLQCRVFHPYNNHYVPLGDIILQMRRMGMKIELLEDGAFENALQRAKDDPAKARVLTTLLAYENMDTGKKIEMIQTENQYTTQVLYRLGFEWSMTSRTYMNRFLEALDGLGFFRTDQTQEGQHA